MTAEFGGQNIMNMLQLDPVFIKTVAVFVVGFIVDQGAVQGTGIKGIAIIEFIFHGTVKTTGIALTGIIAQFKAFNPFATAAWFKVIGRPVTHILAGINDITPLTIVTAVTGKNIQVITTLFRFIVVVGADGDIQCGFLWRTAGNKIHITANGIAFHIRRYRFADFHAFDHFGREKIERSRTRGGFFFGGRNTVAVQRGGTPLRR